MAFPFFARSLFDNLRVATLTATLAVSCQGTTSEPSTPSTSGSGGGGTTTTGAGSGGGNNPSAGANSGGPVSGSAGTTAGGNVSDIGGAGAGGSAGSSAGTTSAGAAGAASSGYCGARAGLTFCEDFEAQAVGAAQAKPPWTPAINGDGQVLIDDQAAHSGGHALKVHGSGFSTFLVLNGGSFPPTTGPLHVRLFMRLAEAITGGHNTFLVADTQAAPGTGNAFRLGEMNAMLMYTVSGDTHGALANENYYNDHLPGAAPAALTWSCVELVLDHQKPEVAVSLDGKAVPDLHHTDWALDTYDTLRIGFEKYAGPVSDVWYDDIAVGTAPLGCQ